MQDLFDLPEGLPLALYWAGRGCRVFPVRYIPATDTHQAQKKPLFQQWQKMATTDVPTIERWWTKWPGAWVGMATGTPGFDVADFDVKDGADGKQSYEKLIEAGLIDGYAFDVDTPSGGWHRFFPGTSQRNGQARGAGVDFRGAGGFVMAPGNPGYVVTAVPAGGPDLQAPLDWQACRDLLRPPAARPQAVSTVPVPAAGVVPAARGRLRSPKPDNSWTDEQAQAEIHRWRGRVASAKVGSINVTLNDAAMRIGHFVPQFLEWSAAVTTLESALALTDYDGRTWLAADTIESGLRAGMREPYERRPDQPPRTAPLPPVPNEPTGPGVAVAPPAAEAALNRRTPIVQRASEIPIRRVRWLWDGRIPVGEITLVAGREGSGKSTLLAWLTRAITRGELPGEYLGQPKAVIYAAAEDSWEHTLAPRMKAAGADLDLVYRVAIRTELGTDTNLVLPLDTVSVFELGAGLDAVALMLDPGLSFLDGRVDIFKSQELRPALETLRRAAEQHQMAVPMLCHFNKTQGTDVLSKIAGSRAFAEVARAALAVAVEQPEEDPEQGGATEEQVILSQAKNNLGRTNLPNLTYQIADTAVPTPEGDAHVGRLVWTGETSRTAEQVLNGVAASAKSSQREVPSPVADWIVRQGRTVSTEEIGAAFPQISRVALRKQLSRLAERGRIYRPVQGHYAPSHDVVTDVTGVTASDHEEDTEHARQVSRDTPPPPRPAVTGHDGHTDTQSPSSTLAVTERESDKSDSVTRDEGGHARARVTHIRPLQDPDPAWLVPGDPYRG